MHRIDTSTATPDHKFTEGDPAVPVAATTVSAAWLNAVQEELVAVITGAGLELKKATTASSGRPSASSSPTPNPAWPPRPSPASCRWAAGWTSPPRACFPS